MYPQRSVMTCGLATALEPPHNKFAALLAAICARIGSRKAKSKAGEIPPFYFPALALFVLESCLPFSICASSFSVNGAVACL